MWSWRRSRRRCSRRSRVGISVGGGQVYLRGLLTDGKRKSVEPMAARLGADGNGQALANFISTSPWDPAHIRAQLAWRMEAAIRPKALIFDDAGFLKDGTASAGSCAPPTASRRLGIHGLAPPSGNRPQTTAPRGARALFQHRATTRSLQIPRDESDPLPVICALPLCGPAPQRLRDRRAPTACQTAERMMARGPPLHLLKPLPAADRVRLHGVAGPERLRVVLVARGRRAPDASSPVPVFADH